MRLLKTVHIHTNSAFVKNSERFRGVYFENLVVFISNGKKKYSQDRNILQLKDSPQDIKKVLSICKDAQLVVLYGLEPIKIGIALCLPESIRIAWRFFGFELYDKRRNLYLSQTTQATLGLKNFFWYFNCFRRKECIKEIFERFAGLVFQNGKNPSFEKSLKRIDFFLGFSKMEYVNLIQKGYPLPEFVKFPFSPPGDNSTIPDFRLKKNEKLPVIIIGNSRNLANNHLDVITIINQIPNNDNYNFYLLFSYGSERYYTKLVRRQVKGKPNFTLLEDFLPREKFFGLYVKASALIINSYRQMALGNIFTAFKNGVKIYLNEKNLTLHWLRKEGFVIFSLKDLQNDFEKNNIFLDYYNACHNLNQLKKLSEKYSYRDFQEILYAKINGGKRQ